MGTIVINQTDCKQNVILQSSLDGITGGFYDASGVWHEIGGAAPLAKYEYKYTDSDFLLMNANYNITSGNVVVTGANANRRCTFGVYDNGKPIVYSGQSVHGNLFPIPIPEDATSVSISITPSTQYVGFSILELSNDQYERTFDPGWNQGSYTGTFTAKENQFATVMSKYDAAGTSYPTEPTEITITFE